MASGAVATSSKDPVAFVTVPEFAFQLRGFDSKQGIAGLDGAIGKWSRGATFGYKGAKGTGLDFNVRTLGQMVENARRRGDKISICQDHLSILGPPVGKSAPSLGFFYALALFDNGTLIDHWSCDGGSPPEADGYDGETRNGLYCRLGEITPLGFDVKEGLANYGFLSPTFPPPDIATDEAGNPVGYTLIDFAATSAPFQSGCPIEFHRIGSVAMASQGAKVVEAAIDSGDKTAAQKALQDVKKRSMLSPDEEQRLLAEIAKMSVGMGPSGDVVDKQGRSVRVGSTVTVGGSSVPHKVLEVLPGGYLKLRPADGSMVVEMPANEVDTGYRMSVSRMRRLLSASINFILSVNQMINMATYRDSKGQTVREGDRVKIVSGQWQGVEGTVDKYGGAGVVPVTKSDGSTVLADEKEIVKMAISMAKTTPYSVGDKIGLDDGDGVKVFGIIREIRENNHSTVDVSFKDGSTHQYDVQLPSGGKTGNGRVGGGFSGKSWINITPMSMNSSTDLSAASAGGTMNPDLTKKLGFADGATPSVADKMAAYGKHAMGDASAEDCMAMADDLEHHEEPVAKALAGKIRSMGDLLVKHEDDDGASAMADGDDDDVTLSDLEDGDDEDDETMSAVAFGKKFPKGSPQAQNAAIHIKSGNEHDEQSYGSWSGGKSSGGKKKAKRASMLSATDRQAMVALAQSLRSKGVTVPSTATRPVLMALAAQYGASTTTTDVATLVRQEIERRDNEAKRVARIEETKQLVAMARTAKAPEHEISALQIVAERDIATARQMANKYNPEHSGAPAHLFTRMTGPSGPISRDGRTVEQPRQPAQIPANGVDRRYVTMGASIQGAKIAVLSAASWAEECRAMADSKEPVTMARIDALLDEGIKGSKYESFERFVAAEKILSAERPDLLRAAKLATSLPVGGV